MVSQRECYLCKAGLEDKIDANARQAQQAVKTAAILAEEAIKSLRREIRLSASITVALVGTFITILGLLLNQGVI